MTELPAFDLPVWMNKGQVAKLAAAAHHWFTRLGEWALWPLKQLDPMTCREAVLELIAWQRDITRFKGEPLDLFRLRVRHAYANARDAGSVEGFKQIFERLGVGYVELEERMPGRDWDVVAICLSDSQLTQNESLLLTLIQHYGRTCRRYEWKIITTIPMEIQVVEFSNDHLTETAILEEP
ncbi:phage tail protein [Desulfoluna spongiiphila]|uniref:phage tail protein n=1 Tax=Desulfoluna spongiiphila TaxID=419481 RepID=UPI00125A0C37|nr:phage tail protein [Desulfoluna spongiiphila]VVS92178.1 tail protein i [Desulfoluna spongiiphila]